MDLGLRNRSALVTGASQGIGRAIAESLAAEGCTVHLAARNAAALEAVRSEIVATHGVEVVVHVADLSEPRSAPALAERCADVDILVNNAGATPRGDILEIDEETWRAGWELKVFGYVNLTRELYRRMAARGHGTIVNVIGLGAEKLEYGYVAGSTGNAALVAFTRTVGSVSVELGVRVLGVNPGWTETERALRSLRRRARETLGDAQRWSELLSEQPGARLLQPREVADVVVFLASDRACGISGHVVTVDAGFGARAYPQAAAELRRLRAARREKP